MKNSKVCPGKKKCPYYLHIAGKCFSECDLTSNYTCGQCVNWQGDCTVDGRHKLYGKCYFQIGNVRADIKTSCPRFYRKPENHKAYSDWIEDKALSLSNGTVTKEHRKMARAAWEEFYS